MRGAHVVGPVGVVLGFGVGAGVVALLEVVDGVAVDVLEPVGAADVEPADVLLGVGVEEQAAPSDAAAATTASLRRVAVRWRRLGLGGIMRAYPGGGARPPRPGTLRL